MVKKISLALAVFLCVQFAFAQKTGTLSTRSHHSWSKQSNIYEVNLRQYSQSGSFKDFEKHLPRLRKMGVEILWFMPITPISLEGRKMTEADLGSYYAVQDYKNTNPEHGTLNDFKKLVKKAHALGFKVITDWVPNHSGRDNHWVKVHPDFYARDSSGKMISPFDWTDVLKLNYGNRELRDSMIDAMQFWIRETGIDGFRCDVAEEVPADFWKDCIAALRKKKPVFMLAEGNKPWLHEAGFDATYTWDMMGATSKVYEGKLSVAQLDSTLNSSISQYPKNAYRLYFTSNHDENSWNGTEYEKYGDAYKLFAVFTQTIANSIPLIYNGQEEPNKKRLKFFVKDTIEWGTYSLAGFYKTILKLRRSTPALATDATYRRLKSSNNNTVFSFIREKNGRKVVVVLNMSATPQKFTIRDKSIYGVPMNVYLGKKEILNAKHEFSMEPWGFAVYDYK